MNEDELFTLIRENYNRSNEDYLKKQVKEALKIPLLSKEETLDGLLNLVVVAGCGGLNEHYRKYLYSAIGHLQAKGEWVDFSMSIKGVPIECCSECGGWSYDMGKNFCPNCGAEMVMGVKDKSTDIEKK